MKDFLGSLPILTVLFISATAATDEMNVVVYGEVGGQITLRAPSDPDIYVFWSYETDGRIVLSKNPYGGVKTNEEWKDRVSLSGNSLTISQLREDDFKTFICKLERRNKPISKTTYSLRMMSVRPSPSSLLAGETLSLRCDLAHSNTLQVRWQDPQQRDLSKDARVRGADGFSLTVRDVNGGDHGRWVCVVTHGHQESSAGAWVVVVDLSPAPKQPIYTSTSSHPPPLLPCSIPSYVSLEELEAKGILGARWTFIPDPPSGLPAGDPKMLLAIGPPPTWEFLQKSDKKLPVLQKNDHNISLGWSGVTEADRGEYTCALDFKGGKTLKRVMRLEVLLVRSSPGSQLLIGQDVNLTCCLGRPLAADLSIKWIRPYQKTPRGTSSHSQSSALNSTHLAIQEVGGGDRGAWRCELWRSKEKLASAEINLKIERAPMDVWLLVTICAASVIFILLLILTVILFRRRQRGTMPRRRKHKFCRCKEPKPKGFYRT